MTLRWQNAAQIEKPRVHLLLYGAPGSGKTHAAFTAPRPLGIFFRNEGSVETVRGAPYPFVEVSSMSEFDEVLNQLIAWQRSGELAKYCDTVVVDGLSHYNEIVESELTDGGRRDMKDQWGKYNTHFARMRQVLWQLDTHVVMTAWDYIKTNKEGQIIRAGVKMYGQTADTIPGSCEAVGFCEQTPGHPTSKFMVHFGQVGRHPARTRIRGMPQTTYESFQWAAHIDPYLRNPAEEEDGKAAE